MEWLVSNLSGVYRDTVLNGRKYRVAPLTLIVPGVLNGSYGSLYYPPEEVAKDPSAWNNVPLILNHPFRDGVPISGRDPEVLQRYGLGFVFRAHVRNDGKLRAEGWFDIEKCKRIAPMIWNALMRRAPIELSTGLFTENHPAPMGATFNGQYYQYIARNYRPDHLAILPDTVGACSLRDGCGVNVVNTKTCCDSCKQGKPCATTTNANCGTGKGGFQKGNSCAGKGKAASAKTDMDKLFDETPGDEGGEDALDAFFKKVEREDSVIKGEPLKPKIKKLRASFEKAKAADKDDAGSAWHSAAIAALSILGGLSGAGAGALLFKALVGNCGGQGGKPGPCPTTSESPTRAGHADRITAILGGDRTTGTKTPEGIIDAIPGVTFWKNAAHPDAVSENKEIAKALFKRITLGTGPHVVKGIKAAVKHAPRAFASLWKGLKKVHSAVKASHAKENAMGAPALARNELMQGLAELWALDKHLTNNPSEVLALNTAVKEFLLNCGGKGGKPGPCKGQKKGTSLAKKEAPKSKTDEVIKGEKIKVGGKVLNAREFLSFVANCGGPGGKPGPCPTGTSDAKKPYSTGHLPSTAPGLEDSKKPKTSKAKQLLSGHATAQRLLRQSQANAKAHRALAEKAKASGDAKKQAYHEENAGVEDRNTKLYTTHVKEARERALAYKKELLAKK